MIANSLGEIADSVFAMPAGDVGSYFAWAGIICYTLQIYFDFSGYSDMAVGLARIFGFRFPENFNYPYVAKSFRDFWRRWHMSLSAWFRDYVYIPLGGNKVSVSRQYFNLILVFFLCGLWHGASWNFVVWGMFHDFFLVIERIGSRFNISGNIYVMFFVMIGWVFFRSPDLSYALTYLKNMFLFAPGVDSIAILRLINSHFTWTIFVLALIGFSPIVKNSTIYLIRRNKAALVFFDFLLLVTFVLIVIRLSAATHNPFIYFQF